MQFEIKNRFTGEVQFTAEIDCAEDTSMAMKVGLAVRWGIRNNANLAGAKLADAYLPILIRSDGYMHLCQQRSDGSLFIKAGCREFTDIASAAKHWRDHKRGDTCPLCLQSLAWLEVVEKILARTARKAAA